MQTNLEIEEMNIAISIRYFTVLIVCLLLISACAPSMELMVAEAERTGDWSQVEKLEDAEAGRRAISQPSMCARKQVAVCQRMGTLGKPTCTCKSKSLLGTGLQSTAMGDTT